MDNGRSIKKPKFFLTCILAVLALSIFLGAPSVDAKNKKASKKTALSVKSKTIYVNGKYTIPLKNKKKKATYFFTSVKTQIAKVNSKGAITGVGRGSTSIKVRYKLNGKFHSVGKFKVTVKKSTLKSEYESLSMLTGNTISPDEYLNNANPDASYLITSSMSSVAKSDGDGVVTAAKAGRTALSIHEIYNKKSRTIGSIALSVTGTSVKYDEIKMAYGSRLSRDAFLEDVVSTSKYSYISSNESLVYASGADLASAKGSGEQSCEVAVEETMSNKYTRKIGSFKVVLTDAPFVSYENQDLSIGIGEQVSVGNGINVTNKVSGASYMLTPADASILQPAASATPTPYPGVTPYPGASGAPSATPYPFASPSASPGPVTVAVSSEKLEGINYGSTTVSIVQTYKDGSSSTLPEIINVSVNAAYISSELTQSGLSLTVGGDTYNKYPVECRNRKNEYYYESADPSICSVATGGMNKDEDYLVATAKKSGTTEITVYETRVEDGYKNRIGSFKVIVGDESGGSGNGSSSSGEVVTPGATNPVASDIFSSISINDKKTGKTYKGAVSDTGLECVFGGDGGDFIDYGTDFKRYNPGIFEIQFKNPAYSLESTTSTDGREWIIRVKLHDADDTVVEVPVTLIPADFDISTIIKDITVKLKGAPPAVIDANTVFPQDDGVKQFENGNKSFFVNFTRAQYAAAGVMDSDFGYTDGSQVFLKNLPAGTVECNYELNTFSPANNPAANAAVTAVSKPPQTNDNSFWTFEISFEDGTKESIDVTLGVAD